MSFWNRIRRQDDADSPSDEALCSEVRAGNHEAFLVLFDRYWQQVFRLANAVIRDKSEAEDLTQALFLEIHTSVLGFDEQKGSFRTLICRYAYTRAIDHRRRLESRRFYSNAQFDDINPAMLIQNSAPWGLSVEEGTHLIEQAMKGLDEKQRSTIEAYFFHGHSLTEIAQQQGDSLGNIRHHLYRGLERMRRFVNERDRAKEPPKLDRSIGTRLQHRLTKRLPSEVSVVRARTI